MMVRVKKSLSLELQKQGFKPLSVDIDYDIFHLEKQLLSRFSNVNKSEYMIMNGNTMSFVRGAYKEVK